MTYTLYQGIIMVILAYRRRYNVNVIVNRSAI